MQSLVRILGAYCLALSSALTFGAPVLPSPFELSERSINLHQKWERDELNCIQILNPAPGATYHPGYFVRMNYAAENCEGVSATGPWSIHLYNNPELKGGRIQYDYHEVIADGLRESQTQYVWIIPSNQEVHSANVRRAADYYVRIETTSQDGVKLVGNAGPFAIYPNDALEDRTDIQRRHDVAQVVPAVPDVSVKSAADLSAGLPSHGPDVAPPLAIGAPDSPMPSVPQTSPMTFGTNMPARPVLPEANPSTPEPTTNNATPLVNVLIAPEADPASSAPITSSSAKKSPIEIPAVPKTYLPVIGSATLTASSEEIPTVVEAPVTRDPTLGSTTPNANVAGGIISQEPVLREGTAPPVGAEVSLSNDPATNNMEDVPAEPHYTEISSKSLIPAQAIVAVAVGAGALGGGILAGNAFGSLGGFLGTIVGGVVGGLAVVLSFVGVPV
ncbi:hypothetical protein BGX28_008587 [Mortierella sp. GBA30]|nr:hypothetical protein BGX28_008587 [Mortierella sp. GBA30]